MLKKEVSEMVDAALAKYPKARENDRLLMVAVWEKQGLPMTIQFVTKFLSKDIASPETIRRTRQKIQQEGRHRPSQLVTDIRKQMAEEVKVEMVQESLL